MRLAYATEVYLHSFKHGGGTFDRHGVPQSFADGYMVGGVVPSRVLAKSVARWPSEYVDAIQDFCDQHKAELSLPNRYLGTWVNDGDLHLDVSEYVQDKVKAYALALLRDELAIWDNRHGNEATAVEIAAEYLRTL